MSRLAASGDDVDGDIFGLELNFELLLGDSEYVLIKSDIAQAH